MKVKIIEYLKKVSKKLLLKIKRHQIIKSSIRQYFEMDDIEDDIAIMREHVEKMKEEIQDL